MNQTEAFRLLASADRQLLLHELCKTDNQATVDGLSEQVAARRHRIAPEKISDAKVDRAYVRLVHKHIPPLVEQNIITYDQESETVDFADEGSVDQLFEAAGEIASWPPEDLLEHPVRTE